MAAPLLRLAAGRHPAACSQAWRAHAAPRRQCRRLASGWPSNTWGETDRHEGWRGSNWSGNVRWTTSELHEPESLEQVCEIVKAARKVRVIGSAHSFSHLVTAEGQPATLLSMRKMPRVCELDEEVQTLEVDAGTTYSEVCSFLSQTRLAIPNTASLPHFSVAGAVATGTHGSSGQLPDGRLALSGLADAVEALELVGPDGECRKVERGQDGFDCSVVSLGMMGVVTRVTLRLVPARQIRTRMYTFGWPSSQEREGSLEAMLHTLPEALRSTGSMSHFVDWSRDDPGILILRDFMTEGEVLEEPAPEWAGTPLRTAPVEGFLDGADLEATGVGPWHDKLPCWMKDAKPMVPQTQPELESEHFVPLVHMQEALERARILCSQWPLLYCELRAIRADGQMLSAYSANEADGCVDTLGIALGFDGTIGEAKVLRMCAVLEEALRDLNARGHWGKLFSYSPADIKHLYGPRLTRFREVREKADPNRKFTNAWLDRMVLDE